MDNGGPPSWLEEYSKRNWHKSVTQFWAEVTDPHGSVEEMAERLATIYAEERGKALNRWRVKRHVLRKLTLDVVCASFPAGTPPPDAIVQLLKRALDLPESHQIGAWPVDAGKWDDRGDPDHEARNTAMLLDWEYIEEHNDYMPLRMLQKRVKDKLGREPDRKSLRSWRAKVDYWGGRWQPPPRSSPRIAG